MKKVIALFLLSVLILGLVGCTKKNTPSSESPQSKENDNTSDVSGAGGEYVRVPLKRGMNMTCFEMQEWRPREYLLEDKYYKALKQKGFDHVRIPVKFSLYCEISGKYTIYDEIFDKLDTAIALATNNGLYAVLDMHGCDDINNNADTYKEMLYAQWEQIASHYRGYDDKLIFELLNEPNQGNKEGPSPLNGDKLNEIQNELIKIIRRTNPDRVLVAAVGENNTVYQMDAVTLPENDPNIIVAIHSYEPMEFTHQGATWSSAGDFSQKVTWKESYKQTISEVLDRAANWSSRTGRQVWLGEFGTCLNIAEQSDVAAYLSYITREAEARDIGWCYWEFWMSFGAFDRYEDKWHDYVVDALIPR